ncbi:MAG: hypothetical protein APF78_01825 [Sphingomonadales bacterium BRH_c3]|nr:MAG: hypothetical protein APF78_01825 [Sphingomonadales bacterium BRH_c3]
MHRIEIRDVCPRDGLQDVTHFIPTAIKFELVKRLYGAGVRSIEATSFVSPRAVPQLADAADLMMMLKAEALPGAVYSVFVANEKGLELAMRAGADEISTTVPASEGMTRANFRIGRGEMLSTVTKLRSTAMDTPMSVTIATAFGCPHDGPVDAQTVIELADSLADAGYRRLFLGDTVGVGNPHQVADLFGRLRERLQDVELGAHFHDPRGIGLANVVAAIEAGATVVDASLGGLGGCPFAPGASGNVATEDVVWALHAMGYAIEPQPTAIVEAAQWLQQCLDIELTSRTPNACRFAWEDRGEKSPAKSVLRDLI